MLAKASVSSLVYPGVLFQFFLALDKSFSISIQPEKQIIAPTYSGWCYIKVTKPDHGFLLIQVSYIGGKMLIPYVFLGECLSRSKRSSAQWVGKVRTFKF